IVGGTVDVGAYENQSPALLPFFTWMQSYGLSTHSSAVYADSDHDGLNNWQEWIGGTDPTNALSRLRIQNLKFSSQNSTVPTVTWESVTTRSYFLERGTNLSVAPSFSLLATNLAGQLGTTSYTDTNAVGSRFFYYRVGVQGP